MIHPLFADILRQARPQPQRPEPVEGCEHDWTVKGYSPPVPHGTLSVPPEVDAPEFVFWVCTKCGEESMEEFQ